jgi:hypothetical protein
MVIGRVGGIVGVAGVLGGHGDILACPAWRFGCARRWAIASDDGKATSSWS